MDRMAQIKSMLNDAPDDLFLKHALALEFVKRGNDEAARRLFEEILQANPDYTGSYYHLGKLYERQQQIHLAKETYQQGIAAASKEGDVHAANELRSALEDLE